MGLYTSRLIKFADKIEKKLEKLAQEIVQEFSPGRDLILLNTKANKTEAFNLANAAVPKTFVGKVTVSISIDKKKNFAITSNVKQAADVLKPKFNPLIKSLLAEAGPVAAPVVWAWFGFEVSEE
jgi:hypothetical protein